MEEKYDNRVHNMVTMVLEENGNTPMTTKQIKNRINERICQKHDGFERPCVKEGQVGDVLIHGYRITPFNVNNVQFNCITSEKVVLGVDEYGERHWIERECRPHKWTISNKKATTL